MADFTAARRMMVDGQIRTADVTDLRVIGAFLQVPRERFVAPSRAALAYLDLDLPMAEEGGARKMLKPMVLAKLIHLAEIADSDRVLLVGAGTGYSAALVSRLAAQVVALEQDTALSGLAERIVPGFATGAVTFANGPLVAGWAAGAPYNVILIEGAVEILPEALTGQLAPGGRLLCIRGSGPGSKAWRYRAGERGISGAPVFDASAPLLQGFAAAPAFVF